MKTKKLVCGVGINDAVYAIPRTVNNTKSN